MNENGPLPPTYIRFDKRQREEFLSQFGITTPAQRDLFHQLCDTWRPLVDFDTFVAARLGQFVHVENEVLNLVARLKSAKLGGLTYKKNDRGERIPDKIVLCDESEDRYWFYFLQDLLLQACENPHNPYLTSALLKTRELLLPMERFLALAPERVSKSGFEELAKQEGLLFLTLQDEKVLATSQTLNALLAFSVAKLRSFLKNPELLTPLSRVLNLGLTDLAKKVEDKDAGFWKTLTEIIVKQRDDLIADRKLHLDRTFFQAAEFFRLYTENQLVESRKQKEEAQERETDLRQVEQIVLGDKDVLVPPEDLDSQIKLLFGEKYGDRFAEFQEDFRAQFMAANQKTGLPSVLVLKAGLLHRNNAYLYFVRRFEVLQALVWQDFSARMEKLLRTSNRGGDLAFVNRDNLEHALSDWTGKNDEFVAEFLGKPKLLAEALIHYGKTSLNLGSVDEMKLLMEQFFRPGVMSLRPLQEIYGLDVRRLFESCFKRLNVVAQFWRRVTGKFKVHAEEFAGLGLGQARPLSIRAAVGAATSAKRLEKVDEPSLEKLNPAERQLRRREWQERQKNTSARKNSPSVPAAESKVAAPAPVRRYSEKEKDQAWTSFRDTLKKD